MVTAPGGDKGEMWKDEWQRKKVENGLGFVHISVSSPFLDGKWWVILENTYITSECKSDGYADDDDDEGLFFPFCTVYVNVIHQQPAYKCDHILCNLLCSFQNTCSICYLPSPVSLLFWCCKILNRLIFQNYKRLWSFKRSTNTALTKIRSSHLLLMMKSSIDKSFDLLIKINIDKDRSFDLLMMNNIDNLLIFW